MLLTTCCAEGDRRILVTKQIQETEAEAVDFVVCQSVGLETGTASRDYVRQTEPNRGYGYYAAERPLRDSHFEIRRL